MAIEEYVAASGGLRFVIQPNRSMTWRQSLIFLAGITVVALSIAVTFAVMGYWLILPFAGLELAALAISLYLVARALHRCEVVTIDAREVRIAKGRLRGRSGRGGPEEEITFQTAWVRVRLEPADTGRARQVLHLAAGGRQVELAGFLTDAERIGLAQRLRERIRAINDDDAKQ